MSAVYIAGPMRGLPEHNLLAFRRAAVLLRSHGHHVISPVEVGEALGGQDCGLTAEQFVQADLRELLDCDAIALLPGWERSTGARCEVTVAITLGFGFYEATTGEPIEAPARVLICGGYDRAPGAIESLDQLRDEALAWQACAFPSATLHSISAHLLKEAKELHAQPSDDEELADVVLLAFGLSRGRDLAGAIRAKLEKNKRRTWGEPDADGVVEHVAEGALGDAAGAPC